jgi:predicted RNase H-like HicB family nuclease
MEFNIIYQKEKEGGFSVFVPSLSGCFSQGDTIEEAKENIKEAIELYLEDTENELIEFENYQLDKVII